MRGDLDSAVAVPATTALADVASYATVGDGATGAVGVDEVEALGGLLIRRRKYL